MSGIFHPVEPDALHSGDVTGAFSVEDPVLEENGRLFYDIRITNRTMKAVLEGRDMLEEDGIFMSTSYALEDMCLYALKKWEEEPDK